MTPSKSALLAGGLIVLAAVLVSLFVFTSGHGRNPLPDAGPAAVPGQKRIPPGWLAYTGAWFKVAYPGKLSVVPLSKSATSVDGFDSARFVMTNDSVEFYIYSPQSGGVEGDYTNEITPNPATETLVEDRTSTSDYVVAGGLWRKKQIVEKDAIMARVIRIAAKDGSYRRQFEIAEDRVCGTRLIFGFRYPDQARFETYKPVYEQFKNSLVQYAD